jgi:hypothetical protein
VLSQKDHKKTLKQTFQARLSDNIGDTLEGMRKAAAEPQGHFAVCTRLTSTQKCAEQSGAAPRKGIRADQNHDGGWVMRA